MCLKEVSASRDCLGRMIEPFPLDQGGSDLGEARCMAVFPL